MMQINPAAGNTVQPQSIDMMQASPYPDASAILEANGAAPQGDMQGADNPVLHALRTLTLYTAAAKQNGDPTAESLIQHLKGFVESMMGGQGAAQAPAGANGAPAPAQAPQPAQNPMGAPEMPTPSAMPMGEPGAAEAEAPSMEAGASNMSFNPFEAPAEPKTDKKAKRNNKNQTRILF